jgi:hypothetical protein
MKPRNLKAVKLSGGNATVRAAFQPHPKSKKGLHMSRKFNHTKVNMQKRIASEYRIYGDPLKKPMFANVAEGVNEKPGKSPVSHKAKRKQIRHPSD